MSTKPTMHPVESTRIHSVGHDGQDGFITFHGNAKKGTPPVTYRYFGMPAETIAALRTAESPGSHFHHNVKDVHTNFERLPD